AEAHPRAPSRHLLPDLVVPWHGPCARDTQSVVSEDVPGFRFAVPGRLPSALSGNHTAGAWFAASGPGVGRGVLHREHGVIDLAPTVLRHLGLADPRMQGAPIDLQATR